MMSRRRFLSCPRRRRTAPIGFIFESNRPRFSRGGSAAAQTPVRLGPMPKERLLPLKIEQGTARSTLKQVLACLKQSACLLLKNFLCGISSCQGAKPRFARLAKHATERAATSQEVAG